MSCRRRSSGIVRTAVVSALLLAAAACTPGADDPSGDTSGDTSVGTPTGCGLVPATRLAGLLGGDVDATARGTLASLRGQHRKLSCRNVVPGHPERFVTIAAEHHPGPMPLPRKACSAGWVYAGTPEKFTPACQETVDGHGRTLLIVRWQPYVMRVSIGRSGRDWAGDPEQALELSRLVAVRLGVREASGNS